MEGNEQRVIVIAGPSGVGKTTVVSKLKDRNPSLTYVNIGTIMTEIGVEKGYVEDRDKIKYLPRSKNLSLQEEAWDKVRDMTGTIIVDTHVTNIRKKEIFSSIPLKTMSPVKGFSAIIYVDASNDDIAKRRSDNESSGQKRERSIESDMEIDARRTLELAALSYYSVQSEIPIYMVYNKEGKSDEAVQRCEEAIKEILE